MIHPFFLNILQSTEHEHSLHIRFNIMSEETSYTSSTISMSGRLYFDSLFWNSGIVADMSGADDGVMFF
jgi:hypothetical protein